MLCSNCAQKLLLECHFALNSMNLFVHLLVVLLRSSQHWQSACIAPAHPDVLVHEHLDTGVFVCIVCVHSVYTFAHTQTPSWLGLPLRPHVQAWQSIDLAAVAQSHCGCICGFFCVIFHCSGTLGMCPHHSLTLNIDIHVPSQAGAQFAVMTSLLLLCCSHQLIVALPALSQAACVVLCVMT